MKRTLSLHELFSFQPYHDSPACNSCLAKFTRIDRETACPACSRLQKNKEICIDCKKWQKEYPDRLIRHRSLYQYDEKLKEWLSQYKFVGDVRFASLFQTDLKKLYHQNKGYIFVPLPISKKSREERGFNQSELLLQTAGVPYQDILINHYSGEKQSEKNRQERLISQQPFQLLNQGEVKNKSFLLFDDVYTTGRTMLHAKALLDSAGAADILSLSIGR